MSAYELLIDPERLILVTVAGKGDQLAVICRYIVVRRGDLFRMAIELTYDPATPAPTAPYYCPRTRLVRSLVPPDWVKRIRPYRTDGAAHTSVRVGAAGS